MATNKKNPAIPTRRPFCCASCTPSSCSWFSFLLRSSTSFRSMIAPILNLPSLLDIFTILPLRGFCQVYLTSLPRRHRRLKHSQACCRDIPRVAVHRTGIHSAHQSRCDPKHQNACIARFRLAILYPMGYNNDVWKYARPTSTMPGSATCGTGRPGRGSTRGSVCAKRPADPWATSTPSATGSANYAFHFGPATASISRKRATRSCC